MKISITAFVLTLGSLGCGVRSACVDVDTYFGAISSGTGEVDLGLTTRLECPKDVDTEIVIPSGAALTVKSGLDAESSVQFKNIRFTVEEGASLVFEMFVRFGPNSQEAYTHAFRVFEDASVTFMDKFRASKITSAFWNNGLVEFKKKSFFNNNNNVFYINSGTLKFRGSSTFKNNDYHGIENHSSGFVRFSKKATFIGNGATYDDTSGCGLENMGGTVIFRGDTLFADHKCKEAAALYNDGKMRFYGTTVFNDNVNEDVPGPGSGLGQGGGLRTWNGADTIFKGDVEFNRNTGDYGGGFGMAGGDITFRQAVSFTDNEATIAGGGFAAIAGNLTFEKEELVTRTGNSAATECPFGWQEDDATIFGFSEFICDEVN